MVLIKNFKSAHEKTLLRTGKDKPQSFMNTPHIKYLYVIRQSNKNGQKAWSYFKTDGIRLVNKIMERCPTSFINREMELKTLRIAFHAD